MCFPFSLGSCGLWDCGEWNGKVGTLNGPGRSRTYPGCPFLGPKVREGGEWEWEAGTGN